MALRSISCGENGVAVELDGWDGHSSRVAFERDRLKVAKLTAHGLTVIPITGRQIRGDSAGVLRRLKQALEARSGGAQHSARVPRARVPPT